MAIVSRGRSRQPRKLTRPAGSDIPADSEEQDDVEISLRDVSHSFTSPDGTSKLAISKVSLEVSKGEFMAVVGPSGCGKTTILNLVSGLLHPTEGSVLVKGSSVQRVGSGDVGYMPARHSLLPWRTALGNVEFALEFNRGITKSERRSRAMEMLSAVGLESVRDAFPHTLSQGMQQRVAIARTFVRDDAILLMDEPFSALDAQTKLVIQEIFLSFWERERRTVVLITHDASEAVALADRVALMSRSPGTVQRVLDIDLPRPRDMEDLLFGDPKFGGYVRQLWAGLRPGRPDLEVDA